MQVDPVEQRPRYLVAIGGDSITAATAVGLAVTQVPAGAGIHRRDELEAGGEIGMLPGTGDRDRPGLHRLSQYLQDVAIELG